MSPGSFIFQEILRRLVLRLVLMMGEMGARRAGLVGRLAGMREGHRHRARLVRELAKAERYAALVAEADFAWSGKAAEVARVMADAGRRALVRRVIWPGRRRRLRAFGLGVVTCDWGGRCTGGLGGLCVPPALPPAPPANAGGESQSFWQTTVIPPCGLTAVARGRTIGAR